jgi:hypothetical protein
VNSAGDGGEGLMLLEKGSRVGSAPNCISGSPSVAQCGIAGGYRFNTRNKESKSCRIKTECSTMAQRFLKVIHFKDETHFIGIHTCLSAVQVLQVHVLYMYVLYTYIHMYIQTKVQYVHGMYCCTYVLTGKKQGGTVLVGWQRMTIC